MAAPAAPSIKFYAITCRRILRPQYRTSCAWRRSAIAATGRTAIVEICASRLPGKRAYARSIRAPRHTVRARRRRACVARYRLPSRPKLLATVDLLDPCQQVAFARRKGNIGLEHRPVPVAQGCVLGRRPVGTSSGATNGVSKTFCSATTIDVTGILKTANPFSPAARKALENPAGFPASPDCARTGPWS